MRWAHRRRALRPGPPPVAGSPSTDRVGLRRRDERGTGMIGTAAAVAAFLVFLLFAVQVVATLYATSTVNAAGYDAARHVASSSVDHDDPGAIRAATASAEDQFRSLLGAMGRRARLDWSIDGTEVRLHVVATTPAILPGGIRDTTHLRQIERTFTVRIERPSR